MWLCRQVDNHYQVGYYKPPMNTPAYDWYCWRRFETEYQAEDLVHFLNGGNPESMIE